MRLLPTVALALLALSACTQTDTEALPRASVPDPVAPETRAEAAGLTPEQATELERLGVPVYVPDLPDGWTLIQQTAALQQEGAFLWPEYVLRYRTPQATCLVLQGASEGLGDIFVEAPPHERDVRVPGVPTDGPVPLGWGVPGERTEGWEDGRVSTEWFGTDGLALSVASDDTDGCWPASPEAAETLAAALRPLDPTDDAILLGPVRMLEPGDDSPPPDEDPEDAARVAFSSTSAEGRQATTVETLRRRDRHAVVLVTTSFGADDSVRDVRTRAVLVLRNTVWHVEAAGQQFRCQPGRGHSDWSAERCS